MMRNIIVVVGCTVSGTAAAVGVGEIVSLPGFDQRVARIEPMPEIAREMLVRELMYEPTRERPRRDWEQRERKKRRR